MAITNQERIGRAMDLLRGALRPFTEREVKATSGDEPKEQRHSNDGPH